ncbi:organic hydroperoxide resistance protein [Microbacterium dauci]|uniref:Organic hydroperoxide resistance protein n=1 Tax=Microbacterium dauci TaxID=3048008 RepID=A0ABT6ZEN4_9MICO|nr:organic hydroperoxide resistance protein [Microbacterium sp. LX3-4]MDJ1114625.1 organic hydroperoxide resistance protein [Microbacterium sp. LX3-4]
MDAIYTAEALATGDGRNGHVRSGDGLVDTDVRIPAEMGGPGGAPNPELLFAAGYAACFHSALQAAARAEKVKLEDTSVGARVHIGSNGEGGFGLAVELEVVIPHLEHDEAQQLADAAHQICPYSNATRGNIEVTVRVVED